ncbi:MAG: hypothetical protein ACJ75R_04125 [Solirubrobacterales bacterium]
MFGGLVLALALAACGEKSEPDLSDIPPPPKPTTTTVAPTTTTTSGTTTTTSPAPPSQAKTPAQTVHAYVAALSAANGARVCALLAPGAIDDIKLPRPSPRCEVALDRSIGYHDPKGPPAFDSATVRRVKVQQKGARAKVVTTVVTRYRSQRRPSTDDDIVYLKRNRAGWLILQPSAILYRAVGLEPPISALKPPPGF